MVGVPAVVPQRGADEAGVEGPVEVGRLGQVVEPLEEPGPLVPPPPQVVAVPRAVKTVLAPPVQAAAGVAPRFGASVTGATVAPPGEVPASGHLLAGVAIRRPPRAGRLGAEVQVEVAVAAIQAVPPDVATAAEPAKAVAHADGAEAGAPVDAPVQVVVIVAGLAGRQTVDQQVLPVRGDSMAALK